VLSDLVRGQVIGLAKDRTQESLEGLLGTCLDARQQAAVKACCIDMAKPYRNAIAKVLPHAEVVFDKFHVLQHASRAIDEVRRAEFLRAGEVMRAYGRGKRWLLLKRWDNLDREERGSLKELFNANRRLYKAYLMREQLDRLWTYKTENGVTSFLLRWIKALRWQRLPEMQKLARTLVALPSVGWHLDGGGCFREERFEDHLTKRSIVVNIVDSGGDRLRVGRAPPIVGRVQAVVTLRLNVICSIVTEHAVVDAA